MTGKFHTHWGEVGGYKKPEALVYECGAMLAHGARCSIGDHLHPTGQIDQSTMAIIAPAYKWVAEREAWADGHHQPRRDRAALGRGSEQAAVCRACPGTTAGPDEGAVRVLLEGKFAFDVVDLESDYSPYRLLILPDAIAVDGKLKAKIEKFVAKGRPGAADRQERHRPGERLRLRRRRRVEGHLAQPGRRLPAAGRGAAGRASSTTRCSCTSRPSRSRSRAASRWATSTSPISTARRGISPATSTPPASPTLSASPPASSKGNFTYLAFPIFSCYQQVGAVAMLEIAEKLIDNALGGERLVTTSLPRAGRVTVRAQAGQKRDVVHLLHATPALRGTTRGAPVQPIQDLDHPERRPGHRRDHRRGKGRAARPVGRSPGVHPGRGRRRLRCAQRHRTSNGGDRLLAPWVRLVGDDGLEPPTSSV